jgi:GNAT superfamily N-acetyltransferase
LALLSGQLGYPAEAAVIARRLDEIVASRAGQVLVAEDGGGAVGWAEVSLQRHLVHDTRAELAGLIVAEGARDRGVGTALLRAAEAWARKRGLGELIVRSNVVRERAHRFYLREGYAEMKRQAVFGRRL